MFDIVISSLLAVVGAALALVAAYLSCLTVAAFLGRHRRPPAPGPGACRFAILVPAHDEAAVIGRLLRNLDDQQYPRQYVDVHVVADNCSDQTAAIARSCGARVYERADIRERGKGFAVRWLLQTLDPAAARYDAYVVLDADSVISPDFLRRMEARLAGGSQVIQAYYTVLNGGDSPMTGLRYAALAAYHYLRPLARSTLGLSCGLKGNGMCFAAAVVQRFGWQWFTLAEDVEFHLALVQAGIRVDFAPEALVLAEMPVSFAQAGSQNARWERGRLDLVRRTIPGLLLEGLRRRSLVRLDAAVEQLIPPLSVPFAAGAACLLAGLAIGNPAAVVLATGSVCAQSVYVLASLALVRAPAGVYRSLLHAPAYVAWKVLLYARALLGTVRGAHAGPWVRTTRGAAPGAAPLAAPAGRFLTQPHHNSQSTGRA